jgi:hypothetical protein
MMKKKEFRAPSPRKIIVHPPIKPSIIAKEDQRSHDNMTLINN